MVKKPPHKTKGKPKGYAKSGLDAIGTDAVCAEVQSGTSLTAIARKNGVSVGALLTWIESDPDRSARVRESRSLMARHWDEKAESAISEAADEFELKKARELASHYRWRASKIRPGEYGDFQRHELTGRDGADLIPASAIDAKSLSDETLAELMAARRAAKAKKDGEV
jgi:hypothetical protein